MPLRFKCVRCQVDLFVREEQAGKIAVCKDCGMSQEIPMVGLPDDPFPIPPKTQPRIHRPVKLAPPEKKGCFGMLLAAAGILGAAAAAIVLALARLR